MKHLLIVALLALFSLITATTSTLHAADDIAAAATPLSPSHLPLLPAVHSQLHPATTLWASALTLPFLSPLSPALKSPRILTGLLLSGLGLAAWRTIHVTRHSHHLHDVLLSSAEGQDHDPTLASDHTSANELFHNQQHFDPDQSPLRFPFPIMEDEEWNKELNNYIWPVALDRAEYGDAHAITLDNMNDINKDLSKILLLYAQKITSEVAPEDQPTTDHLLMLLTTHLDTVQQNIKELEQQSQQKAWSNPGELNALLVQGWLVLNYFKIVLADSERVYPQLKRKHMVLGLGALPEFLKFEHKEQQEALSKSYFLLTSSETSVAFQRQVASEANGEHVVQDPASSVVLASKSTFANRKQFQQRLKDINRQIAQNTAKAQSLKTLVQYQQEGQQPPYYQHFLDHHRHQILQTHRYFVELKDTTNLPQEEEWRITHTMHGLIAESLNVHSQLPQIIEDTALILRSLPPEPPPSEDEYTVDIETSTDIDL